MHVHIFPGKIAQKAADAIGKFYDDFNMECNGTLEMALAETERAGITRFCAHSVATTARQVENINRFIMEAYSAYPERIVPFAAMHPALENVRDTAEAVIAQGFRGIKLHPEIQGFKLDAPDVLDMIAPFEGKIPLLVHCGDYRYDNSSPARIRNLLKAFPKLTVICAHLGGWTVWEQAAAELPGENVWVDTSSSLFALTPEQAASYIRAYTVDRAMYGTDYPMWNPVGERARFDMLPLTESEREKILWTNHLKLFPIESEIL